MEDHDATQLPAMHLGDADQHQQNEGPNDMTDNWNDNVIAEFHANDGRVGGNFEGAPVVLVHHRGRKSGRDYVTPMMYLPDDADNDTIYVFATKGGAPSNPDWYYNLTAAGEGTVERGTETYPVTVRELTATSATASTTSRPGGTQASPTTPSKTAGIRTIPVLALRRHEVVQDR